MVISFLLFILHINGSVAGLFSWLQTREHDGDAT